MVLKVSIHDFISKYPFSGHLPDSNALCPSAPTFSPNTWHNFQKSQYCSECYAVLGGPGAGVAESCWCWRDVAGWWQCSDIVLSANGNQFAAELRRLSCSSGYSQGESCSSSLAVHGSWQNTPMHWQQQQLLLSKPAVLLTRGGGYCSAIAQA